MFGRTQRDSDGLPCFDLLVGWLLWGMRNSRAHVAPEVGSSVLEFAHRDPPGA